jgi:DNA transposition AAA+ family ATPase
MNVRTTNVEARPYEPVRLPIGALPIPTEPFEAVQAFGRQVLALAGILLILGPSGTGKTYSADTLCATLGVPVVKLHLGSRARGFDVLRTMLQELGLPSTSTGRLLLEEAREALRGRVLVIYVDEAHNLNAEALQQIRYLFDQRDACFALVLTAVDFSGAYASTPELATRISRQVEFGPLRGVALLKALKAHHPILKATTDEVLRRLDQYACRGVWRRWENVLVSAAGYGASATSGITDEIAGLVLGAVPPALDGPHGPTARA